MINKPSIRPTFKTIDSDTNITIKKAMEIQNILVKNNDNDKQLKRYGTNYMIEYITILNMLEDTTKNYSDEYIQTKINNLHNKIFKNRRY